MVKPEATLMSLTHIYMTDPFPVTSIKSGGLKSVLWSQTFLLINYKSYKMKYSDKITEKQKKVKKHKIIKKKTKQYLTKYTNRRKRQNRYP